MSFLDEGFNNFMEKSIEADPNAQILPTLPARSVRSINFDDVQVSGSLGNVLQLGGSIEGGTIRNLAIEENLTLLGQLIVGSSAFVIDGRDIQMVVKDETGTQRILIGRLPGGF